MPRKAAAKAHARQSQRGAKLDCAQVKHPRCLRRVGETIEQGWGACACAWA